MRKYANWTEQTLRPFIAKLLDQLRKENRNKDEVSVSFKILQD